MNNPFLKLMQTQDGWQAMFAFQVFHHPPEVWMKMRWGFNAGVLLDEALDRYKLFIESQSVNEDEFHAGILQNNTLVLRGIHSPEFGLKMILLGKSFAPEKEQARQAAQQYACEVFSTFPHDFLLVPIKTESAYQHLSGDELLVRDVNVAQIQRGVLSLSTAHGPRYVVGLWQSSSRANEQIWRALSAMPQAALFNILIQPSALFAPEKHALLDIKKDVTKPEQHDENNLAYIPWVESYTKQRLAPWRKFFVAQVHLVVDGKMDNLLRSVGSALTREAKDAPLPGYQARYPISKSEGLQWRENIRSLELTENSLHLDDLADVDEVFAIFRFPYRPEAGLPGANFNEMEKEPDSSLG